MSSTTTLVESESAAMPARKGPLAGPPPVRIVGLTHVFAGPFCLHHLADLGAEIIVVENKNSPDSARGFGPTRDPNVKDGPGAQSLYHASLNRFKNIALDFNDPDDLAVMKDLIAGADVFVYNQRPGMMQKFGLDYASLMRGKDAERYKYGIHCHISGNRDSTEGAFDLKAMAEAGVLGVVAKVDGKQRSPGLSLADMGGGITAALAICAELSRRNLTGVGNLIQIDMIDAVRNFFLHPFASATREINPTEPDGLGVHHATIMPFGVFACADGTEIVITCGTDDSFVKLANILGFTEDEKSKYRTNNDRAAVKDELKAAMEAKLVSKTADVWLKELTEQGVVAALSRGVRESFEQDQKAEPGRRFRPVVDSDGSTVFQMPVSGIHVPSDGENNGSIPLTSDQPDANGAEIRAMLEAGTWVARPATARVLGAGTAVAMGHEDIQARQALAGQLGLPVEQLQTLSPEALAKITAAIQTGATR